MEALNFAEYVKTTHKLIPRPVDPYKIIADLNEKLKVAEKKLFYYELDGRMHYKKEKRVRLYNYNYRYGTKFKHLSEFIEVMYSRGMRASKIGKYLDLDTQTVLVILHKLGAKVRGRGGPNNVIFPKMEVIEDIRTSNEKYYVLAERYKMSVPTVARIRNKKGRWANY